MKNHQTNEAKSHEQLNLKDGEMIRDGMSINVRKTLRQVGHVKVFVFFSFVWTSQSEFYSRLVFQAKWNEVFF